MSTPQMTTPEALRSALASTIACSAQELQEAVGQVVVATAAELPAASAVEPADRSLFDATTSTLVLLADRIPAGQEAQALAAEVERHHGRQAAQLILGDRADDLLTPVKARIEFKVSEPDPGRSLGAVFVPKGEPLSGGLFGDAQTDMVEFSDLRYGVARAVKYLGAAAIAGMSKGHRYSAFYGATISVDDSQKLAAWVAEMQARGLANSVDQSALADKAFADYEFGDGVMVTDSSGWEYTSPGHERSRKVYVETQPEDDGPAPRWALNFTVRFDPATGALSEAFAMDQKGELWGAMPIQQGTSILEPGQAVSDALEGLAGEFQAAYAEDPRAMFRYVRDQLLTHASDRRNFNVPAVEFLKEMNAEQHQAFILSKVVPALCSAGWPKEGTERLQETLLAVVEKLWSDSPSNRLDDIPSP